MANKRTPPYQKHTTFHTLLLSRHHPVYDPKLAAEHLQSIPHPYLHSSTLTTFGTARLKWHFQANPSRVRVFSNLRYCITSDTWTGAVPQVIRKTATIWPTTMKKYLDDELEEEVLKRLWIRICRLSNFDRGWLQRALYFRFCCITTVEREREFRVVVEARKYRAVGAQYRNGIDLVRRLRSRLRKIEEDKDTVVGEGTEDWKDEMDGAFDEAFGDQEEEEQWSDDYEEAECSGQDDDGGVILPDYIPEEEGEQDWRGWWLWEQHRQQESGEEVPVHEEALGREWWERISGSLAPRERDQVLGDVEESDIAERQSIIWEAATRAQELELRDSVLQSIEQGADPSLAERITVWQDLMDL